MCERIPEDALPRRTFLAAAGALFLTACTSARRRRARLPRRVASRLPVARPPMAVPQAPTPIPVILRAAWGAEPLKDNHDPMARITRITLHHTAELPNMASRSDHELVKAIQRFHRNQRGWADIGYHYLVGRDGTIFEGRALTVQGAHAGASNNIENLGVSAIGDFSGALPPPVQLDAIEAFLVEQQRRYAVGTDQVFGHRDFKATECPGSPLYAWLGRYKAAHG